MSSLQQWKVVTDDDGDYHTECPNGHRDGIVEVDSAIRWNTLRLTGEATAVADLGGTGDYDFESWTCKDCLSVGDHSTLAEPDGFEVTSWE